MRQLITGCALAIAISGVAQSMLPPQQGNAPAAKPWLNPSLTYGSVTDIDGNTYATIQIGTQVWMAENLRTTRYRNGEPLVELPLSKAVPTEGAWHWGYNPVFGRTYSGYAINDNRRLCPTGWHIPTYQEWDEALGLIGHGKELFSSFCPSAVQMNDVGASVINASGFSAIPLIGGKYLYDTTLGWWTASLREALPVQVELAILQYERMSLDEDPIEGLEHEEIHVNWADLLPVRCVKD